MAITLKVNGRTHTLDLDPATPLLYALSDDLQLNGPKFGCGLGQCGACTVIVKGQAVRSCVTTVKSVEGSDITTLEGLGTPEKPHPIQQAFINEQAAQCGFCLNGVIMTAKAFLDKNPKATETEIQQAMSGVLCRCFTNVRMLRAIAQYGRGDGTMKLHRRDFLKASGGLIVSFSLRAQGPLQGSPPLNQLDSWIAIAADGSITAYSGKEELGQGISTAQQQLVAEELSVPFNRVKLIYCDTALTPDQAHTSGSQSHPANFNSNNLAQAGATAREALLRLASQKLGIPVDQLTANDGVITSGSKRVTYGQLVEGKKFSLALDPKAKRKSPNTVDSIGKADRTPRPSRSGDRKIRVRPQRAAAGNGARTRGSSAVSGCDGIERRESSVAGMPGVTKVVVKKNFVGVVAEKPWQAIQAAAKLKVTWNPGKALPDQATFHESSAQAARA